MRATMAIALLATAILLHVLACASPLKETKQVNGTLHGLFGGASMIGMARCQDRWERGAAWGRSVGLSLTRVHATEFEEVSLQHPPIPVIGIADPNWVRAGQVGCTMSHIRVWRDAFKHNHSHILVLEDDVTLTDDLVSQLPALLRAADLGAEARGMPWHYIYLRAYATELLSPPPPTWHESNSRLTVAHPAWGTAAYILSAAGARFLLTRVTSYKHPLDVQIERLQRGLESAGARFVALDACAWRLQGPHACPENVRELTEREKGNCHYSASQAGGVLPAAAFPRFSSPLVLQH